MRFKTTSVINTVFIIIWISINRVLYLFGRGLEYYITTSFDRKKKSIYRGGAAQIMNIGCTIVSKKEIKSKNGKKKT